MVRFSPHGCATCKYCSNEFGCSYAQVPKKSSVYCLSRTGIIDHGIDSGRAYFNDDALVKQCLPNSTDRQTNKQSFIFQQSEEERKEEKVCTRQQQLLPIFKIAIG